MLSARWRLFGPFSMEHKWIASAERAVVILMSSNDHSKCLRKCYSTVTRTGADQNLASRFVFEFDHR